MILIKSSHCIILIMPSNTYLSVIIEIIITLLPYQFFIFDSLYYDISALFLNKCCLK